VLRGETEVTATLHIKVMTQSHSWDSIHERDRDTATSKGKNFLYDSGMAEACGVFGFHIEEDHVLNLKFSDNKSQLKRYG
jgi:hypothetical protein